MFPAQKNLSLLSPEMKKRTESWLQLCKDSGLNICVTETLRTKQRQLWLYAKGRILPNALEKQYLGYDDQNILSMPKEKQVTWTLQSKHLSGLALDFGFLINGSFSYNGDWEKAYDLAEQCGLKSLYREKKIDRPHLELDETWTIPLPVPAQILKDLEDQYKDRAEILNQDLVKLNFIKQKLAEAKGTKYKPHFIS